MWADLAPPWPRRRRFGAGALASPVPAITRGLPAPPRTAPPTPVAVRPHKPGAPASDWRLSTSQGCSAHVALAPRTLPPALDAPTQGLASSWWSAARPRRRRGGVRSCPSVDICSRHCACRQGTLAPGRAGVVRRSLWGLGAPKPLPAETDRWSIGLLLPGCVPRGHRERARAPSPERPP